MDLKNKNGFTGIDISISLIIILIFIPTIFGVVYNVEKTDKSVKREAKAISITTEILEVAKNIGVQDIDLEEESDFLIELSKKNYIQTDNSRSNILENEERRTYSYTDEDDVRYRIDISLLYPNNEKNDIVKVIKVSVEYPIGNTTKVVEISTVLESV